MGHAAKHNAANDFDRHNISGVREPAHLCFLRTFGDVAWSTAFRNLLVHVTAARALFAHSLGVAARVHVLFRGLWVPQFQS